MMALSDHGARPCKTPNTEKWVLRTTVTIGATGAVSDHDGDNGIVLARTGTGTYSVAYPACPKASILVNLVSPSKTVVTSVLTAKSSTAGTATLKTLAGTNAAADTDPASGDLIEVAITAQPYSV
jgi:hypothetical protein